MSEIPLIGTWEGKRLGQLSKKQLIAIIMEREKHHRADVENLQLSRDMWVRSTFDLVKKRAAFSAIR
jgi:hypothetical protein